MAFLWFLCGLCIGLGVFAWSVRHINRKLSNLIRSVSGDPMTRLSPLSHITRLLNHQLSQQATLVAQVQGLQDILQVAPIGYLEVDNADRLYWHNAKAAQLLNLNPEKIAVHSQRLLLQVIRSFELDHLIKQVRQAQQCHQQDWTLHLPPVGDSERPLDLPLRGHGIPLPADHVGVFLEDRQEAITLAEERDRWTADVAHELKTPLTSMRLVAETLQSQVDPHLNSWVERLLKESVRLGALVQDLLELNQITVKHPHTLQLRPVDLAGLVRSAWLNLEPLAQAKNLLLYYQGPDQLIIQADEPRLYRVLTNLMDNGIKYSPPDQPLIVELSMVSRPSLIEEKSELSLDPHWVCLDVIDMGSGFPEESLPHVFKRFYRADPSRTRPQTSTDIHAHCPMSGTSHPLSTVNVSPGARTQATSPLAPPGGSGLGLAIVQRIVVAHGGMVRARNHPKTGGGWLQVLLPQKEQTSLNPQPSHQ